MHAEYASYIEEPITSYRKEIFQRLIRHVSGGSVCDLGCHAVGHYWALGYAERVDHISYYDISDKALELQQRAIDLLTPNEISTRYGDTVEHLNRHHISSGDADRIAIAIHENSDGVNRFDFLNDTPTSIFDWVIAIESLEIVKTTGELKQSFKTARALLRPHQGTLLAVVVPYQSHDENVECLCNAGLEGLLNPGLEDTRKALSDAGFSDVFVETVKTSMENYPDAYFITARHS